MFAKQLKLARKNKNLTQEELAALVDTTKATISNYENEYSEPSIGMLSKLSTTLSVSIDFLCGNNVNTDTYKDAYRKDLEKQLRDLEKYYESKKDELLFKLSLLD